MLERPAKCRKGERLAALDCPSEDNPVGHIQCLERMVERYMPKCLTRSLRAMQVRIHAPRTNGIEGVLRKAGQADRHVGQLRDL